jgi:hypothetical protein
MDDESSIAVISGLLGVNVAVRFRQPLLLLLFQDKDDCQKNASVLRIDLKCDRDCKAIIFFLF